MTSKLNGLPVRPSIRSLDWEHLENVVDVYIYIFKKIFLDQLRDIFCGDILNVNFSYILLDYVRRHLDLDLREIERGRRLVLRIVQVSSVGRHPGARRFLRTNILDSHHCCLQGR